jgi:hypothetical protein
MSRRTHTTRTRLNNSHYPSFQVHWIEDEDYGGWTGVAQIWSDGNTKDGGEHKIFVSFFSISETACLFSTMERVSKVVTPR